VSYHSDALLSTTSSVRTFLYVKNLRIAPACIRPDDSAARPDDTQCSTKASGFLSKTQIWEDSCHRPDNIDFCLDALIHKASIAIQIQTSRGQSSWSRCASNRYGNCVHQISRRDDHPPGLDAQSLYMEITCIRRATVRTKKAPPSRHGLKKGKNFSEILEQLISQLSVWMAHVYRPDSAQFLSSHNVAPSVKDVLPLYFINSFCLQAQCSPRHQCQCIGG
jgi:hypothetical protein